MSGEFLHNFCMYQNAMLKVGSKGSQYKTSIVSETNVDLDINDMMSATVRAERKLSDVMDVSDSYNEILKMIM
jgi:hypothetical protein